MARRIVTLEEKIEKAQAEVAETKAKYDKAVDTLEKLLTKRQERDNKHLLEAFSESEKILAEVIEFLQGNKSNEE
jgi:ribosome-associated translation inhibitor RaiA